MRGITQRSVHDAMQQLTEHGGTTTLRAIREALGNTGSLQTISAYRLTFRQASATPPTSLADVVHEEVARALRERSMLTGLETRLAAAEAEARTAAETVARLAARLTIAQQQIKDLEGQAEILINRITAVEKLDNRRALQLERNERVFER